MNKVLVVIDAQEDFTRGALRNEESIKAIPVIHDIVKFAKDNNFNSIIYTKDTHYQGYLETQEGKNLPVEHCMEGTFGHELCEEVLTDYDNNVYVIEKETFGYPGWYKFGLTDADEIWICGFCTDICVSANFQIIKANYPEVLITVISDACAGVTPELHEAALKVMKSCQAHIIKWEDLKKENTDA